MKTLISILFLLVALGLQAADVKITALPSTNALHSPDIFPVVTQPGGAGATTMKATIATLANSLSADQKMVTNITGPVGFTWSGTGTLTATTPSEVLTNGATQNITFSAVTVSTISPTSLSDNQIAYSAAGTKTLTSLGAGTSGNILVSQGASAKPVYTNSVDAGLIGSGTVATARLGSGSASSSTFLRGDQTWASTSGSQTPWTSDIDAAGKKLTNVNYIAVTNGITSTNAASDPYTENYGYQAGGSNDQFSANVGYQAEQGGTNEQFSAFLGYQAGAFTYNAYASVGIGYTAFKGSPNAVSSVGIGYAAFASTPGISTSVAVGVHSGEASSNFTDVEVVGYHTLEQSTNISNGIYIGDRTGGFTSNSIGNLFLGDSQGIGGSYNYQILIDTMGGVDATHKNGGAMIGGDFNARNLAIRGSVSVTNAVNAYNVSVTNSLTALNVTATNQVVAVGFQSPTNLFSGNNFVVGTNFTLTCSSNLNFTGVGGISPNANYLYGELTVKATGTVVVTNPASWFCNDGLTNRTLTNGNLGEFSMKVVPGFSTNFVFTQHWHP